MYISTLRNIYHTYKYCIYRLFLIIEICYEKLAALIVEAEKSYDLPSARDPGKPVLIVPVYIWRADSVNSSPKEREDKMRCPS